MRWVTLVLTTFLSFWAEIALAQNLGSMEFDARILNESEKRIVQAALVLSGDYDGMLDGSWGRGSQRALESYARRYSGTEKPLFGDVRTLLAAFETEWSMNGWKIMYLEDADFSYAHPFGLLLKSYDNKLEFDASDNSLSLNVYFDASASAILYHRSMLDMAEVGSKPYTFTQADTLITAVTMKNGLWGYVRSSARNGIAVTFSIMAVEYQRNRMALMASSMQRGRSDDLAIPPDGPLHALMQGADVQANPTEGVSAPVPEGLGALAESGTGFFVNNTDLVTAAHVIKDCTRLTLADGSALTVTASDVGLDLAVLSTTARSANFLALSPSTVPRMGEQVTALGYPYLGSLSQGLTVTGGNVSAMQGIDGSRDEVMISAPVQPGNSGGPLLNAQGAVIGVVVARVNDISILKETGTLPQNMNFAVPNGPLTAFLHRTGVLFPVSAQTDVEIASGIPDSILAAVVPVMCFQ